LKRVLFASLHEYIPFRAGGLESSTHELVLALHSAGVHASVLSAAPNVLEESEERERPASLILDRDLGYDVYRAASPPEALSAVVDQADIETVIIHCERNPSLAVAAQSIGAAIVIYIRDVEFGPRSWALSMLRNAKFIANSRFTAERSAFQYGLDCAVIPPLINRTRYMISSTRQHVLFVNPLPKKGAEIAFALAERRPDIAFDFVESWPIDAPLLKLYRIRAHSLKNINWHERRKDMREFYAKAKLVLFPSIWEEGWGRIVSEAQVCGIPSLASNRGALPESVGPGGVLVHKIHSIDAWENNLIQIWNDNEYYDELSLAATRYSGRPEISEEIVLARFLNVIES
jgi:glycosyltransferase involved in cell wall biosynthesis